jgi:hypothetical protein
MPSRCWLTLKAPPLSLNNYASIYIYLSLVCNKRRDDSSATESRLGLAQSLLRERAYPRFCVCKLRMHLSFWETQ